MKLATVARLALTSVVAVSAVSTSAQESAKCDYVVQQVSFENTTGLTAEQSSALEKTVLGLCFPRNNPAALSEAVYNQLCKWGFKRAMVEDPNHGHSVRVLNAAVHPSPVAVVIDFRLYGTDDTQAATPEATAALDEQSARRKQSFAHGRDLLLQRGVPFDPDELLKVNWRGTLQRTFAAMPEMSQVRFETAPLAGVYLADTLYLPENVRLVGDTVIITNHLVFEGNSPVVHGPHGLYVFPVFPTAVLGTSLAQAL